MELLLGKKTNYKGYYDPNLLYPIARAIGREKIGIEGKLPFKSGFDIWNCYEVSWLNAKGKPEVRVLEFMVPHFSKNIIESKSLKLYLNSFNGTRFENDGVVTDLIKSDLSKICDTEIHAELKNINNYVGDTLSGFEGANLDELDVEVQNFDLNADLLTIEDNTKEVCEVVYSNLLKSNCLVTNQPDWASVQISYQGPKIDHKSLLLYILSFRDHNEFHEQCVERIFNDISNKCAPTELEVYARYTRRGGIDINPIRSSKDLKATGVNNFRQIRQ